MKQIAIYGAGGFGKEVMILLEHINAVTPKWQVTGFYDDGIEKNTLINGVTVLGGLEELKAVKVPTAVVIAIGDSNIRFIIRSRLKNVNLEYPTLIHPRAIVGSYVNLGEGTIVTANTILTVNITVGKFVIINLACTVGHDAVLEDFTSFMPSVNISGGVIVRKGAYVGTGAQILNHLEIGAFTKVGAGAVVKESLPAHCTAVGVPAITVKYHKH